MGCGSYWAIVYGCRDISSLCTSDEISDQLDQILYEEAGTQTSYEGSSQYAGVVLLSTLARGSDGGIPGAVMGVDEFAAAVRKAVRGAKLKKAKATWNRVRKAAAKIGVTLPEGELLWLSDYD